MQSAVKLLAGVIGLLVWAWFAYTGKTPVEPLITFIQVGLTALATHAGLAFRKGAP